MSKSEIDNFTAVELKAKLDSGDISLQDLGVEGLYKLMAYETERICSGDGDVELIEACAALLCEKDTAPNMDNAFEKAFSQGKEQKRVKRFSLKKGLLVADCIGLLIGGILTIASSFGFNAFDFIGKIVTMPDGTEIDVNGDTYFNGGIVTKYATMEEAAEKEKPNILYPATLPAGMELDCVAAANSPNGGRNIQMKTKCGTLVIVIDTDVVIDGNPLTGDGVYTKGGITYRLLEGKIENKACAWFHVDGNAYSIQAREQEDLMFVLDSMIKMYEERGRQ